MVSERPKQGDVFKDDRDGTATFSEAFPDVTTLHMEVLEKGKGTEGLGVRRFSRLSLREYVNCSSPDCSGRGFSLAQLLRHMLHEKLTQYHGEHPCEGHEATRPCANTFLVRIEMATGV